MMAIAAHINTPVNRKQVHSNVIRLGIINNMYIYIYIYIYIWLMDTQVNTQKYRNFQPTIVSYIPVRY